MTPDDNATTQTSDSTADQYAAAGAIQGLPVPGYRPQPQETIDLVRANKVIEERTLRILDDLATRADVDPRWLAIGRTDIERGFMAINRAVFRPDRAALPEDATSASSPS